jgi:hypothetical protein
MSGCGSTGQPWCAHGVPTAWGVGAYPAHERQVDATDDLHLVNVRKCSSCLTGTTISTLLHKGTVPTRTGTTIHTLLRAGTVMPLCTCSHCCLQNNSRTPSQKIGGWDSRHKCMVEFNQCIFEGSSPTDGVPWRVTCPPLVCHELKHPHRCSDTPMYVMHSHSSSFGLTTRRHKTKQTQNKIKLNKR